MDLGGGGAAPLRIKRLSPAGEQELGLGKSGEIWKSPPPSLPEENPSAKVDFFAFQAFQGVGRQNYTGIYGKLKILPTESRHCRIQNWGDPEELPKFWLMKKNSPKFGMGIHRAWS